MCLIVLAIGQHPEYPLILAANRDEFHERPTLAADFWPQQPEMLAGRDDAHVLQLVGEMINAHTPASRTQ